jgi:hypothetical protein
MNILISLIKNMIFDYSGTYIVSFRDNYKFLVSKNTLEIISSESHEPINWYDMTEGILFKDHFVLKRYPYTKDHLFVSNCCFYGLVVVNKGENIQVYNIDSKKYINLPYHLSDKHLSKDGKLRIEFNRVRTLDDKYIWYFETIGTCFMRRGVKTLSDVFVYDARQYKNKVVISTNFGLIYDGKYITSKRVNYDFGIIQDYLYWSEK